MRYCYTINSIGLNIVFFASTRAAYNYAVQHNIRMANSKIKVNRCRTDVALAVRKDFSEYLKKQKHGD